MIIDPWLRKVTQIFVAPHWRKIVHSPQGAPELTSVNFEDLSSVGNPFESLCEQCSLHSAVSPSRCKLSGVGIVKVILEIPARRCIEGRFSTKSAPTVARVLRIVQRGQHQYQGEWFKEDAGIKERCTRHTGVRSACRLEICQKIYRTEDFRVKNLHRKRVIFDIC